MRASSSFVALFALVFAACGGSDDAAQPAPTAPVVETVAKTTVMYGPAAATRLTPYPSNRYTREDSTSKTGLRPNLSASTTSDSFVGAYPSQVEELNKKDGFSTVGGAVAHFSGPVDPATLSEAAGAARLVNVDPKSKGFGEVVKHDVLYFPTDPEELVPNGDYAVIVTPAAPLRPRTKYAFVLTDVIKDTSGAPVGASPDMKKLLSGETKGTYEDDVRAAVTVVKEKAQLGASKIVVATTFTTLGPHDELLAAAQAIRAGAPTKLTSIDVAKDGKRDVDPVRIGFTGKFQAPEYRSKSDAKFVIESGLPKSQGDVELLFNLDFSDKSKSGPRPVVIFAHGLNGDRDGTWGTSERLSELGVAVIGIDSPEHGDRKPNKDSFPTFSFFGIDAKTGTFDMGRARDNFRQMTLDQLALARLIETLGTLDVLPAGAPDGVPDLDVSKVLYIGHSFGSVQAGTFLSLTKVVRAAVLNVGGAGLTTLLRDSNTFKVLVNGFRPPGTTDGDVARFFVAVQAIVDEGDAANFAPFVVKEGLPGLDGWAPTNILIQEVLDDTIVPNSSTSLLANAFGLVHAGPQLSDIKGLSSAPVPLMGNAGGGSVTAGIYQFDTMDGKKASHGELIFTNDAKSQYVRFFKDALAGNSPTIAAP